MAREVVTSSGFKKTLAGSILIHIIIILLLALVRTEPKRTFLAPYTVNILDSVPGKAAVAREEPLQEKKPTPEEVKEKKAPDEAVPEPKGPEKPAPQKKDTRLAAKKEPVPSTKKEAGVLKKEEVSVEDAIKGISEKVKKKEEKELVSSKIEEMERRHRGSGGAESVEDIRKRLGKLSPVEDGARASGKSGLNERYGDYIRAVGEKVQENWSYPVELVSEKTSVIVSVRIGRKGELLGISLEKSSGSSRFDSSLLNAVRKTAPFPPLPVDFEEGHIEIGLRFCPSCE